MRVRALWSVDTTVVIAGITALEWRRGGRGPRGREREASLSQYEDGGESSCA
jgi:hypothetical protein